MRQRHGSGYQIFVLMSNIECMKRSGTLWIALMIPFTMRIGWEQDKNMFQCTKCCCFIKYVLYGKFKCYCKYHHHCLCDKTAVKHLSMKVASKTLPLKVTFFVKTVDNSNLQLNWIQHKNMFQCTKCCCFIKYVLYGKFKCHCKCHHHCLCGKTAVKHLSMKVAS